MADCERFAILLSRGTKDLADLIRLVPKSTERIAAGNSISARIAFVFVFLKKTFKGDRYNVLWGE
jgi:hypothetical protein